MNVSAHSASVLGGKDTSHWCQSFGSRNFFLVFEVRGPHASIEGKKFLDTVSERVKDHPPTTARQFRDILKFSSGIEFTYSYGATLFSGENVVCVVKNGGKILIKREGNIGLLVSQDGIVSGKVRVGDTYLLLSKGITAAATNEEIRKALGFTNPEDVAESLALSIHAQDVLPVGAGNVVQISGGNDSPKPKLPPAFSMPRVPLRLPIPQAITQMPNLRLQVPFRLNVLSLVVALLALLLVGSIGFGIRKQSEKNEMNKRELSLAKISHLYDEGIALVELNTIRARELLKEAEALTKEELSRTSDEKEKAELEALLIKISEGTRVALRSMGITPTSFYELDLVKPGGEGSSFVLSHDTLIVLDTKNAVLYKIGLGTKSAKIIIGTKELTVGRFIAEINGEIFIFADGIYQLPQEGTALKKIFNKDPEWGSIVDMDRYGGNLYLLDSGKNEIWKYVAIESGFSDKKTYLLPDTQKDLRNSQDLVIDGLVWVAGEKGVVQFNQGRDTSWHIKGLDTPLGRHLRVYTSESTSGIYIFDTDNKRVVVTDKEGVYLAQYRWEEGLMVSDMVVVEEFRKILLLSRGTIYAIDVK